MATAERWGWIARNEKPPDGVSGGGIRGEEKGEDPGDADQRVSRPPARSPLGEVGPLIGHRLGYSGVGLAPLLPPRWTRTQFVLATRSLIGPPARSR